MPYSARISRLLPWFLVLLVLLPAAAAWYLQQTQHRRDVERFNEHLADVSPRFFQHVNLAQALASQVQKWVQTGGTDWAEFKPETDWHERLPYSFGYGYAELRDGKLAVAHETLRSGKPAEGRNLLETKVIETAWREALRNGTGATTVPFAAVAEAPADLILIARPVYSGRKVPETPEARTSAAIGLAYSLADPDLLFTHGMKSADRKFLAVERLAWDAPVEKSDLVRTLVVSISGFGWKFRVTPGPEFFSVSDHRTPYLILAAGLMLAAGVIALHRMQETRRRELEEINRGLDLRVASLTASLARENEQLRLAEAQSAKALARERELGELKGRVVSTVSHEFRTPLSVILSSSEILRVYHEKLDPAQRLDYLVSIEDSVRRMNSLIQGVLAFGKAGAGKLGFNPEKFETEPLLRQIVGESLSATSRKCPITLETQDLPAELWVDPVLFRLILGNLLGNAVKYSPAGSPVTAIARREGDRLLLAISDRGIGIPERDLPGLFEAFHRGHNTHGIPGTGLGLSIVRSCAERHGGTVTVSSVEGEGSTFTVDLPVFADPSASPATPQPFP